MNIALFTMDGLMFVLRWVHIVVGIIWIGHLYYFNFTQGPFFNETDAATKSNAIQKLVPRALWWFRWGAMFTFITGLLMLMVMGHQSPTIFVTARGILILIGAALATLMWANVWFVIWPAQKVVIQNATNVAAGKPAIADAAARGTRAGIASRTNVLYSIPMLFFMAASTHLPVFIEPDVSLWPLIIAMVVIMGAIQLNALKGKMGPMASIPGVVHLGLILALVMYALVEVLA